MSGPPRLRSMNIADTEPRPVLGPAGNKARPENTRKAASKPLKRAEKPPSQETEKKAASSPPQRVKLPVVLRQQAQEHHHHHALLVSSMSASCSSDASSSDSSHSGKAVRRGVVASVRTKQCGPKAEKKVERIGIESISANKVGGGGIVATLDSDGCLDSKKRCAWITPSADQCYIAFHDEEWGVPVHDDKKLFELLSLSGALAELTWPAILNKRDIFREVFLNFDPVAISKLNEKKFTAPGSPATSLLSELKLRAMIENARQMCKVIEEFGSFDKFIWSFVNYKPIASQIRYPRQVPVKTPKAEVISKDLVRRGFRSVGPTVIYIFMQVAGLTNDHLVSCFRFQECLATVEARERDGGIFQSKADGKTETPDEPTDHHLLARAIDNLVVISK